MNIPIPVAADVSEDDGFVGMSPAVDKALALLHNQGVTLKSVYTDPDAVAELPHPPMPPGRAYMVKGTFAIVVQKDTGALVTTLPIVAVLNTLQEYTPHVVEQDPYLAKLAAEYADKDGKVKDEPAWWKQRISTREGRNITVKRTESGNVRIYTNGELTYRDLEISDAEDLFDQGEISEYVLSAVEYVLGITK
jgi:hypothetical protein